MKAKYLAITIPFLLLLFSSVAYASLEIDVNVEKSGIMPLEDQNITAIANERGYGIILVVQPDEGTPWIDFLDTYPSLKSFYTSLPNDIKTELADKIGDMVVSFKMVFFPGGGGSETVTFPEDFIGINGEPSMEPMGEYDVVFVYISWEREYSQVSCYLLVAEEFNSVGGSWFVIPEVPLGTIVTLLGMFAAIPAFFIIKRVKKADKN